MMFRPQGTTATFVRNIFAILRRSTRITERLVVVRGLSALSLTRMGANRGLFSLFLFLYARCRLVRVGVNGDKSKNVPSSTAWNEPSAKTGKMLRTKLDHR